MSQTNVTTLPHIEVIAKQKEHHNKIRFENEFIALLKKYKVEYDERYLWK